MTLGVIAYYQLQFNEGLSKFPVSFLLAKLNSRHVFAL